MLPFSLLASYSEEVFDADGETLGFLYGKVWTEYAQSSLMTVFLWIAALLFVSLLGAGILVRFKRQESLKSYVTVALSLAVGFSLTVIIAMLSLAFMEMNEKGRINELLLYPAATLAGTVLLGAAVTYGASLFGKKPFRIAATVSAGLAAAAFVALLVCIGVYYGRNIDGDGYFNSDAAKVNQIVLYLSAALLLAALFDFIRRNLHCAQFCALIFKTVGNAAGRFDYVRIPPSAHDLFVYVRHEKGRIRRTHLRRFTGSARPLDHSSRTVPARLSRGVCRNRRCGHVFERKKT